MAIIDVILEGTGGELARERIDERALLDGDTSGAIHRAIRSWDLAPGDTIRIVEVE